MTMMKVLLQCCLLGYLSSSAFVRASILDAIYDSQLSALESVYNATGYDGPEAIEYCDNEGVICDNEGFILGIDLREKQLDGTIPSNIGELFDCEL